MFYCWKRQQTIADYFEAFHSFLVEKITIIRETYEQFKGNN